VKYRKKPLIIEAIKFNELKPDEVIDFTSGLAWRDSHWDRGIKHMAIKTLEGVLHAKHGDYIIKGIAGEFYPIKSEIFLESYEPAEIEVL